MQKLTDDIKKGMNSSILIVQFVWTECNKIKQIIYFYS